MISPLFDLKYYELAKLLIDELKRDPDIETWWDSKQNWEQDDMINLLADLIKAGIYDI